MITALTVKIKFFPRSQTLIISRSDIVGIAVYPGLRLRSANGTKVVDRIESRGEKIRVYFHGKKPMRAEHLASDYFNEKVWMATNSR